MIYLKYFSKYREWMGMSGEVIDANPANVSELKSLILTRHANASKMLEDSSCIVAVNQQVVQGNQALLSSGDEVAFYPPVSGG